jgi:hypothetical protein
VVTVSRGGTSNTEFVLHPACLEEGSYVDGGLRWGLQAAQAILYIRFVAVSDPDRWIVYDQCIVGIDHTATGVEHPQHGPDSGSITKTVHLVRGRPGSRGITSEGCTSRSCVGTCHRPLSARSAGPLFMIPVPATEKVVWDVRMLPEHPHMAIRQQGSGGIVCACCPPAPLLSR